jgi:RNA polymerase sigma-70 factor, ECF subfamily
MVPCWLPAEATIHLQCRAAFPIMTASRELPTVSVAMSDNSSFFAVMSRLQGSDPDAAVRVFERYWQRLLALARSRLDARLQAKLDPEDITQSVFKSFFRRQADGQFNLTDWDSLWSLLVVITLRKCGHRIE